MRSKGWISVILLVFLPSLGTAQEDSRRNLVVPLADGGFVAFKNETSKVGATNSSGPVQELQGDFRALAFADENRVIHRVLVDAAGKYLFGYDLLIQAVRESKTFNIAVTPLDSEIEKKLLAKTSDGHSTRIATLPQSAEPQILDDGDSFALDLLVNQKAAVKIVDFVKVSFDRSNLWNEKLKAPPRDFTLDAVALRVTDFRLLIDGNLVAEGKHRKDLAGALIWCYLEGEGRFIFSLVSREGYQFQKVGMITDNRIEFTVKGKHYDWLSSAPILPGGGAWNLWVLHDPTYLPFGSQQISRQEKSRLDKLDESIEAAKDKAAKIGDPIPSTFRKQPETQASAVQPKRFRVMVGAADRIENLWPK